MFSYQPNLQTWTNKILSIQDLVNQIKNNPNKDKISRLHSLEYKCSDYIKLKKGLPCVKIYGSFSSLKGSSVEKLNTYMYFDIDDTNIEPNELVKEYPFITLATKSVGGRGIFFIVNLSNIDININNHRDIWLYLRNNIFTNLNIDMNAYSLPRNVFIPYDVNCFFNERGSFSIDKVSLEETIKEIKGVKKVKVNNNTKDPYDITLNEPNDIKELFNRIKIRTEYTKDIKDLYAIEEVESYRILIPRFIKDGTKHKLYARIINALVYLNNNISLEDTIMYLLLVNKQANPPMNERELSRYTSHIYNNIITTGEVKIKPRIKKIHFDMKKELTVREKQSIAAKVNGTLRSNKTKDIIQEAIMTLASMNEIPTNKRICEITGLSLATVKRNKNKDKKDPLFYNGDTDLITNKKVESLEVIKEESFFDDKPNDKPKSKTIEYKYKGFIDTKIEITIEDKDRFLTILNSLKIDNIEPSEQILLDINFMDKFKINYLYNIWRERNKYNGEINNIA
jgi:hypothetical protein